MKFATYKLSAVLLLSSFSLIGLSGCEDAAKAPPAPVPKVQAIKVKMAEVVPKHEFVGRTEASQDIVIKSKVRGNLLTKSFNEGTSVEEGALLFEIDPEQYKAAVRSSKAEVSQAKAAYDTAVLNFNRGEGLIKDNFISRSDYDKLLSQKLQTAAALEAAKASLSNAELELGYTKIYAPFTGRISRSNVFTGDLISPEQTELASLVQMEPAWVSFQLPERVIIQAQRASQSNDQIRMSDFPIKLRFPDGTEHDEIGVLDFVDNRVDPTTGTLSMRATFANDDQVIVPGLYVTVIVESSSSEKVLVIPQRAVQQDQQGWYVLTVGQDNTVVRKNVSLGERYGIDWEVEQGLSENDTVITEGLQKVRVGGEVEFELETVQPFGENNTEG